MWYSGNILDGHLRVLLKKTHTASSSNGTQEKDSGSVFWDTLYFDVFSWYKIL